MRGIVALWVCAMGVAVLAGPILAANAPQPAPVEIVRYEGESSRVHVEPARQADQSGLAVVFEGTQDLHYYADEKSAGAPGMQLKVEAISDRLTFGPPVYPRSRLIDDPVGDKIRVYVGNFTIFIPIPKESLAQAGPEAAVAVRITGLACTSKLCLPPFDKSVSATIRPEDVGSWKQIAAEVSQPPTQLELTPVGSSTSLRSAARYFPLAILAGASINIMPCVLPVLPLILMRLIGQAGRPKRQRIGSGLAFCAGVIFFFALFALISAIVNLTTGAVLDLNSLFRYPAAVIVLFLAIVFFAMAMLDVVTLTLPSSIAAGQGAATQAAGSAGLGFFAALLSTPCSGALLGFVLVWAQTQPLLVSSTTIILMGVGMALPYAVIVLIPSLLDRLPKPGYWMEIFKKSTGFLLLFIAVKLTLAALPKDRLLNVLTYGVVFSFCVWMWGKWTAFSTPTTKVWTTRVTALALAAGTGLWLLPAQARSAVDWQPYDAIAIRQATDQDRPVLLKFTADWCANCKIVERTVYRDPAVADLIRRKNVLAVKADTTVIDYPATRDFTQVYGEAGNLPVTIVLLPGGTREKLRGTFDKAELTRILTGLPEAKP